MMEDRIKIDGDWYIKESTVDKVKIEIDPTWTRGFVVEDDDYCFEFSVLDMDNKTAMPTLTFTDKRTKPWKEPEYWDNPKWLLGVLNGEEQTTDDVGSYHFTDVGLQTVKMVIKLADEKGWLDED